MSTATPARSSRRSTPSVSGTPTDKSQQLPSPPSSQEDVLNNKRKRLVSSTPNPKLALRSNSVITTPNPKPRKQSKRLSSPAQADSPTKPSRARTPATRYEPPRDKFTPPRDKFTPPREITLSPPKVRSRPPSAKGKLVVQVKHEKPDIDLSLPLPPPSPSDDPILLHGRPRRTIVHDVDNDTTTILDDLSEPLATTGEIPQPIFTLPGAQAARSSTENNNIDSSPSNASTSQSHPSSSPNRPAIPSYFDFATLPEQGPSDSDMTDDDNDHQDHHNNEQGGVPMPVFNLSQPIADDAGDDWSSSDSEVEEGEGEYTGTFHTFTIPIKADPPTSTTKARMEEWDAKVRRSPHPIAAVHYSSSPSRSEASRIDISRSEVLSQPEFVRPQSSATNDNGSGNATLPSLSEDEDDQLPPSDDIDESQHLDEPGGRVDESGAADDHRSDSGSVLEYADDSPPPPIERQEQQPEPEPEPEPRTPSPEPPHEASERTQLPSPPSSPLPPPFEPTAFANTFTSTPFVHGIAGTVDAIAPIEFDFSTIETPGAIASTSVAPHDWAADQASAEEEEEVQVEEDQNPINLDDSLIEITSSDPYAAARATAILKAHNYECFTRASLKRSIPPDLEKVKKGSRRRDLSSASIRKSPLKSPRKPLFVRGDSVYFEGSPMRTLPDLLVEAEEEVSVEQSILQPDLRRPTEDERDEEEVSLFCTPPPRRRSLQVKRRRPGGEWVKDDWKALDSCFTDERLALGAAQAGVDEDEDGEEILADVGAVDLSAVVKRFAELYDYDLDDYGEGPWSRKGLMKRANALRSKQRSGKGAPPTRPRRSSSAFSFRMDSPSFDAPDFTPSAKRYNTKRPAFPDPSNDRNPFAHTTKNTTMPKSLLAPRYSHLLDEARSVSFSLPSPAKDEPSESSLGMGKKVQGLIYSYIKSASPGPSTSASTSSTGMSSLPLPPPINGPRAPITTPARPLPDRYSLPPVDLEHVSPPSAPPPKLKEKPRRMVDLNHVPTPEKMKHVVPMKRLERKGSVKDLVRSFEDRSVSGDFTDGESETKRVLRELKEEKARSDIQARSRGSSLPAQRA